MDNRHARYDYNRRWRQENAQKCRDRNAQWAKEHPERHKTIRKKAAMNQRLKRKGITLEDYSSMLETQGGCCAICGSTETGTKNDWHIDHCHETGRVRGLLCHHCNTGLGSARDNPEILRSMINYLEKHKWKDK